MRIVIAPDKFKGSLSADEVANAMAKGAREVLPQAAVRFMPQADGGEGTVAALLLAVGGRVEEVLVPGPRGVRVTAPVGKLSDGRAVIESASACGLDLLGEGLAPMEASSEGLGDLILHAAADRPTELIVGVGGTATTDGGTGAARALGWRFLDRAGRDLPLGGAALVDLAHIDGEHVTGAAARITAACDVDAPLTGPNGAARTFGPQKGADPEQVLILESAMECLADRMRLDLGFEVDGLARAGAGGGLGAGLSAFFGATLEDGFACVAASGGLASAIEDADLVLTGEGRLDEQSLAGKVPIGVASIAARAGVRCLAVAGDIRLTRSQLKKAGVEAALSLTDEPALATKPTDEGVAAATKSLLRRIFDKTPAPRRGML